MTRASETRAGFGTRLRKGAQRHPLLATVTAAYLVAFTVYGLATGARLTIPYVLLVGGLVLAVAGADDRVGFSTPVLVGLSAWGAGHLAGGLVELSGSRILYNVVIARWFHVDNMVHFVGFGFAGAACWEATRHWLPARPGHRLGVVVVVCLFGMGVGALNEVVEFAASHLLNAKNVGGYENTGRDLVSNLLGSLTAGIVVNRRDSRGPERGPQSLSSRP